MEVKKLRKHELIGVGFVVESRRVAMGGTKGGGDIDASGAESVSFDVVLWVSVGSSLDVSNTVGFVGFEFVGVASAFMSSSIGSELRPCIIG